MPCIGVPSKVSVTFTRTQVMFVDRLTLERWQRPFRSGVSCMPSLLPLDSSSAIRCDTHGPRRSEAVQGRQSCRIQCYGS